MHEARRHSTAVALRGVELAPRWNGGENPADVAIVDEQGLGDAVLMARWIPWVIETTGRIPRFYGRAPLRRWIEAAGCEFVESPVQPDSRIDATGAGPIAESSVALAMSLPFLAGCAAPSEIPDPFAPNTLLRARAQHTASDRCHDGHRRVGVCWTSTGGNLNKQLRFSAEQFGEVWSSIDGVEFVNLAHGARVGAEAPFGMRRFADVFETGGVMTSLDFVVTVDTMVAHLAGSLGIPTIVIAPTYYDWRYRWPGENGSAFYPSISVLRQRAGDDVSVLARARANLVTAVGPR